MRRVVFCITVMGATLIIASGVALAVDRIQITGLVCNAPGDDSKNKNLSGKYVLLHDT
jgi:hypothetical protein